mmetsp:Transcript_15694/g.43383  ORF Transcript_15694/g.43383 Transcript_15694/m.43383 type:complete len:179 (-) Transcript_15694:104-640(-)
MSVSLLCVARVLLALAVAGPATGVEAPASTGKAKDQAGALAPASKDKAKDKADVCESSEAAACECLLACDIFGGDTSGCKKEGHEKRAVDLAVYAAMTKNASGAQCPGIRCIFECAKRMDCHVKAIEKKCLEVIEEDETCDIECKPEEKPKSACAGTPLPVAALLLVVACAGLPSLRS